MANAKTMRRKKKFKKRPPICKALGRPFELIYEKSKSPTKNFDLRKQFFVRMQTFW